MAREVRYDGTGAFEVRFPFDEELVEQIKSLPNRRWNAAGRHWWVPEEDVLALVELLRNRGFVFCAATRERYQSAGGGAPAEPAGRPAGLFDEGAPVAERPATDYTVSRLNLEAQDALERAFPRSVWLVGEISGFQRNAHKRAVSFQLVEREEGGRVRSSIEATLFDSTRRAIERALAIEGSPFRFEDEVTVRVRSRVELYVPWGSYRLRIEDLDVRYTMGEAARRREEILRRLVQAGLAGQNAALPFPAFPLRVGLVTSLNSDAYNDVLRTLEESRYAFRLLAHGARMQGHATEASMLNALDALRARSHELDVVLICRGGGSRTDLAWLDSEALARAVARFPVPVIVGIGHEQDQSVLDAVGRRAKTPTAAAALLVETVRQGHEALERKGREVAGRAAERLRSAESRGAELARRVVIATRVLLQSAGSDAAHARERTVRSARAVLVASGRRLDQRAGDLIRGARRDAAAARRALRESAAGLASAPLRLVAREGERALGRARRVRLSDPRSVIERGYAVLRGPDGRVLTLPAAAPAGSALSAELRGGTLRLRSEGPDGGGGE